MAHIVLQRASQFFYGYSLLLVFVLSPTAIAQKLDFFVSYPQSPPILYKNESTGAFEGIIPDIFNSMPEESRVRINYIQYTRIRGEEALYNDEVDAAILTKEWASAPDKLLFTLPIFQHRDFLYSNKPVSSTLELEKVISGKDVCTRRGYVYPELQHFFNQGIASKVNISTESAELGMLLLDRCQLAIVNEFIADWLINNNYWQDKIYRVPPPLNSIDFTLAFTPKWQTFVETLNQHIIKIEQNGQLADIIDRNRNPRATTQQ